MMSTVCNLFAFTVDYGEWSLRRQRQHCVDLMSSDLLSSLDRKGSFLFFWTIGLEKEKHKRRLDTGAKSAPRSTSGWQSIDPNSHTPQTPWWGIEGKLRSVCYHWKCLCFILIHLLSRKENTSFIRCCVTGVKYNRLRRKVKQLPIWDYKTETPLSSFPQNYGFYRHNKMAHVHRSHWLPWVIGFYKTLYLAHPAGLGTVWWLSLCSCS